MNTKSLLIRAITIFHLLLCLCALPVFAAGLDPGDSYISFSEFRVNGEVISLPATLSTGDEVTAHFTYFNDTDVDASGFVFMDGGDYSNGAWNIPPGAQGSGVYTFWRATPGVVSNMTLQLYAGDVGLTIAEEPIPGSITYEQAYVDPGASYINFSEFRVNGEVVALPATVSTGDQVTAYFEYFNDTDVYAWGYIYADGAEASYGAYAAPPATKGSGEYSFWRSSPGIISNMQLMLAAEGVGINLAEEAIPGEITYRQADIDPGNSFINFTEFRVNGEVITLPVNLTTGERITAYFTYFNDTNVEALGYIAADFIEYSFGGYTIPPGGEGFGTFTFWNSS
jgi:hypothetical protein